jgi:deoxyuridine 5'-triphosphate nucleotidohydrolase
MVSRCILPFFQPTNHAVLRIEMATPTEPTIPGANLREYKIKLLEPWATMPLRKEDGAAGWDIRLHQILKVDGGVTFFRTGIAIEPPSGMNGLLFPRSSLAKTDYWLANGVGVIDNSYRGELLVALRTYPAPFSPRPLHLPADYVQYVPQCCLASNGNVVLTQTNDSLSTTQRGAGGFGSTTTPDGRYEK